jgi:N-acylglucosamine-6-phosphate 2-epimerase
MNTLDQLRRGLVVSCQPVTDGPMDRPEIVAAMAQAAVVGGAAGVRIEGVENLRIVRKTVAVPIIGLVKRDDSGTPVRITPRVADALDLVRAGADVIAFDATDRPRADPRGAILDAILSAGCLAMADCAEQSDAVWAAERGAHILGTTLSGYTERTARPDDAPDYDLIIALTVLGRFVMAEGRFNRPDLVARACAAGADAVTVGTALTRLEVMTRWFADALPPQESRE